MDKIPGEQIDDSIVESAEYNILPRPHELIISHIRSNAAKSKYTKEQSSTSKDSKRKSSKKSKEKETKERSSKNKIIKKGNSKSSSDTERAAKDLKISRSKMLDSKFESYVKKAMKSMHSYSSSQEIPSDISVKSNKQQYLKEMSNTAFTAQERYDILNAKDNVIRLTVGKEDSQIKKISGNCPDMCPEKERYSRIAKNCLSILETKMALDSLTNSKDVDHRYMVKEYSRSSADQQEPLPHELRPVSVLKFTMDYLICNIINRHPENISTADWFDFIWNRTRSIRKDITQQQLCDPESVEIIEKCVRFHIFCAEALSEEDTATFDPKINNENLTKCLQTLKHMYHDLQTRGILCPNEAEFRAYDILLSLTEGETLRLVKDIQKSILKSPYVKFAFEAALAFESNNYVKFFKLMEKASYLNSCILHRYIHEARIRAVQVIIRAYSRPNYSMSYPLSNLVRDLKFENESEAAEFCKWHGLTTDNEYVTIERQVFSKPSSAFPVARSTKLVSKKLTTGLGEIINNGKLPANPLTWYKPHDSFDSEGKLIKGQFTQANDSDQEAMDQDETNNQNEAINEKEINNQKSINQEKTVKQSIPFEKRIDDSKSNASEGIQSNQIDFDVCEKEMRERILSKMRSVKEVDSGKSSPFSSFFSPTQKLFTDGEHQKRLSYSASVSKSDADAKKSSTFKFFSSQPNEFKENSAKQFSFFQSPMEKSDQHHSTSVTPPKIVKPIQQEKNDSIKSPATISVELTSAPCKANNSFSKSIKISDVELEKSKSPVVPSLSKFNTTFTANKSIELKKDEDINQLCTTSKKKSPPPQILPFDEISESEISEPEIDFEEKIGEGDSSIDEETLLKFRNETRNALVSDISDEIYAQCIEELSVDICEEIITDEVKRKKEYEDNLLSFRHYLALKTIYKWKLFCQRKKQRKLLENFEPLSPWVPMLINTEYVSSGATSPFTAYKKHREVSRMADMKLKECRQKPGWECLEPTSFSLVTNYPNYPPVYLRNTGINTFFKLGIIFAIYPDDNLSIFREWIFSKFKLTSLPIKEDKEDVLSFYTLNGGKTLICIRGITMESSDNIIDEFLHGISAVILCCPSRFASPEKFEATLQWMSKIFDERNLPNPFPLFTILLESSQKHNIVNQLSAYLDERLQLGQDFSIIKMIKISKICNSLENTNELVKAVKWLIENQEKPPDIICYNLKDYLEDTFATAFDTLFWKLSLKEFKSLMQMPNEMITFYNKVFQTRASLLDSEALERIQQFWPPEELMMLQHGYKFIDKNLQEKCKNLMEELCLPFFDGDHNSTADVWMYVNSIRSVHGAQKDILYYSVKSILESQSEINWPLIIGKCAYFAVCSYCSSFENILEKQVFVTKGDLDDVNFDRHWQNTLISLTEQEKYVYKRKACEPELRDVKKKKDDTMSFLSPISKDETLFKEFSEEISCDCIIPVASSCKVKNMLHSLQAAIKKQNEESDRFTQRLDDSISGNYHSEDNQCSAYMIKEISKNDIPQPSSPQDCKITNLNYIDSAYTQSSSPVYQTSSFKESSSWRNIVGRTSPVLEHSSLSNIFEQLDELKYKIQRNKLIEESLLCESLL